MIEISGTTAVNGSEVVAAGDSYEQTKFIIEKFSSILNEAGSSLKDNHLKIVNTFCNKPILL